MTGFTPSVGIFLRVSYFVFVLVHIRTKKKSPVFSLPFINGDSCSIIVVLCVGLRTATMIFIQIPA